jgi:hypothetical protein
MRCGPWGTSRRVALLAVLCSLPACAGKSESAPGPPLTVQGGSSLAFASGTRLKAHYLDGGGGARRLLAFHDSLLDIECNFVETAPGQYACLPLLQTYWFSDAACTAPTLPAVGRCPSAPAFVAGELISVRSADCNALVGACSLVAQETQDPAFALSFNGACAAPLQRPASEGLWTTQPEPLARFVRGTASTVGAVGGIQATRVTGEDGAFTALDLVTAGSTCTPIAFDAVERCVPGLLGQLFLNAYTDSSCTDQNVALVARSATQQCAAASPQYVVESTATACAVESAVYTLGEPLSRVYDGLDSCVAVDLDRPGYVGSSFYRFGPLIDARALAALPPVEIGVGAVSVGYFADRTGVPLIARGSEAHFGQWSLPDHSPCALLADPSGQTRCVHNWVTMGAASYFADPSCAEPVYAADTTCDPYALTYLVDSTYDTCAARFSQAYAANPYSGPLYTVQAGSCQPNTAPLSATAFFAPGAAVDLSVFPAIADTTDP